MLHHPLYVFLSLTNCIISSSNCNNRLRKPLPLQIYRANICVHLPDVSIWSSADLRSDFSSPILISVIMSYKSRKIYKKSKCFLIDSANRTIARIDSGIITWTSMIMKMLISLSYLYREWWSLCTPGFRAIPAAWSTPEACRN